MVNVSVIIPVYNTEHYLKKCLDSVLAQTLKNIEIICVNDGSTDSCPDILQQYAKKDKRIRLIQKENGGSVSAREAGVKAAKGEYTGFVDSDDWIEPEMYEKLYLYGTQYRTDLVSSGYFFEGNYITVHYDDLSPGLYKGTDMDVLRENAIFNTKAKEVGVRGSLCCKLFRTEQIKRIHAGLPKTLSMSEDKMCVLTCLLDCTSVYITKEAYYHYMIHPGSMVHTPNPHYLEAVHAVYQYLIRLYDHPKFTESMRTQAEIYITEMLYKGINSRMGFKNRNLFWIDPYWLSKLAYGSRVVLYGAGELGAAYRQQLRSREDLIFTACVDEAWERFSGDPLQVLSPRRLPELEYDVVVITIKNPQKAREVRQNLTALGIPEEKLLWFEQKEIFWKYAEVNGWI